MKQPIFLFNNTVSLIHDKNQTWTLSKVIDLAAAIPSP